MRRKKVELVDEDAGIDALLSLASVALGSGSTGTGHGEAGLPQLPFPHSNGTLRPHIYSRGRGDTTFEQSVIGNCSDAR